jgi:hypothetical protein
MQIDTEHLHYWMQAIRQSPDPIRTMDAFWKGQVSSKEWLIENLRLFVDKPVSIDIHGGWVGVLSSLLFQSGLPINNIRSIDIDPTCEPIAVMMNKLEEIEGKFLAVTSDMCEIYSNSDIVINTSCEHISEEQYRKWLSNVSPQSLLILQSNNYQIPEHVRTATSLTEFITQCNINVMWSGEFKLPLYTRYMIIGKTL